MYFKYFVLDLYSKELHMECIIYSTLITAQVGKRNLNIIINVHSTHLSLIFMILLMGRISCSICKHVSKTVFSKRRWCVQIKSLQAVIVEGERCVQNPVCCSAKSSSLAMSSGASRRRSDNPDRRTSAMHASMSRSGNEVAWRRWPC